MQLAARLLQLPLGLLLLTSNLVIAQSPEDPWEKARWIHKAAKALGQSEGLSEKDELDRLLSMNRADVVDYFIEQPAFADATLGAFLHFMGRDVDKIKSADPYTQGFTYNPMAFTVPQAIASARRVMDNRQLDLFTMYPDLVLRPMQTPRRLFGDLPEKEQREAIRDTMLEGLDQAMQTLKGAGAGKISGCEKLRNTLEAVDGGLGFNAAGFDPQLESMIRNAWLSALVEDPAAKEMQVQPPLCSRIDVTGETIAVELNRIKEAFTSFFAAIPDTSAHTPVKSLKDFIILPQPPAMRPLITPFSREGFWNQLRNTSTNYNRKRSAYMLRTYFCDELGAIEIEPSKHSEKKHASDPACMSCHYKLDPLAGLFRTYGTQGTNFENINLLIFDDGIDMDGDRLNAYLGSWKNEKGEWDVGYYTEAGIPHRNWQGNKLSDFMTFAGKAKDVQMCFVRRMAEHFIGPGLTYDGVWLNELADAWQTEDNKSVGFKHLIKRFILSRSFETFDPQPGVCYDGPSQTETNRPPCLIASIVETNCKSCHNTSHASGGLNLSQWVDVGEGRFGFPHLKNGIQRDPKESFQILRKRITGSELGPKMPPGRTIIPTDRQKFYEWLTQIIEH
ncbi:MAG TPA: hypothetical protein VE954_21360 [Oligoflexus sp.]|uniref:hypothetical protein n=1 Tax=Oligoflexus sp. TaxID=1971216 RepID=UPI002D28F992|nr:hypothetical protein [Oligoflexus sp.]HYX35654.1 hypothetical protein [Oligoflexus sp.]